MSDLSSDISEEPTIQMPTLDAVEEMRFLNRRICRLTERVDALEEQLRRRHPHPIKGFVQRTMRIHSHRYLHGHEYHIADWRCGRFWLNFNHPAFRTHDQEKVWNSRRHVQPGLTFEWSLAARGLHPSHSIGIRFEAFNDHDWTAHVELFDISFYLCGKHTYPASWAKWLAREPKGRERDYIDEREIGLRWFEGTLWWHLYWPVGSWHSTDPKWRSGHWNPADFFFGRAKYQRVLRREDANTTIILPEYRYPARIQISDNYWTRPRRLFGHQFEQKVVRAEVEFTEYAPPHAGKGENSWDCDDDATYSITMPIPAGIYHEIEWARVHARASIMATRKKTGDRGANWNWRANPVRKLPANDVSVGDATLSKSPGYLVSDGDNHSPSEAE